MSNIKTRSSQKWEFNGFISLELTEADKQEYGYWAEPTVDELHQAMSTLIGANYKISVSWSTWEDAYQVAITCKDAESKYCGYCITLPHENPITGLVVMRQVFEAEIATDRLLTDKEQLEVGY